MSIKERIQKDRLEAMKSKDMFGKNVHGFCMITFSQEASGT